MDPPVKAIEDACTEYQSYKLGFDVIEKTLADLLKDALTDEAKRITNRTNDDFFSMEETQRVLGFFWLKRRVKDAGRLQEKLIKRQNEGKPIEPYYKYVNDLVGNRVVCHHPDDVLTVCRVIKQCCDNEMLVAPRLSEIKEAEVRYGDFCLLKLQKFKSAGFETSGPHAAGYTSVHFNFCLGPKFLAGTKRYEEERKALRRMRDAGYIFEDCMVEIQVRSILEDAWIEIDHATRYESQTLINDHDMLQDARAMSALMQAANVYIRVIRNRAHAKREEKQNGEKG